MNVALKFAVVVISVLASVAGIAEAEGSRTRVSLDGSWAFKLDPESIGEEQRWYESDTAFDSAIDVPGAWDNQGFGDETEKLRHNYIGKGWYKRRVDVPAYEGQDRAYLTFGGVYRSAKVWVNGHFVGEHIGYVSEFEWDVTSYVTPGKPALIAIQVDSEQDWEKDALQGCVDIIDHLFTYWGGIWGHVDLEIRSAVWLDDVFVQPRIDPTGCRVSATLRGEGEQFDSAAVTITSADGVEVARSQVSLSRDATELAADIDIPGATLWTPEEPYLYSARIELLRDGERLDVQDTRFGVRVIEIRGTDFLLNGTKIFLAGYGDDATYGETMIPPSDNQYYLDRLQVAKNYGFNHVRHHSHFVTPEYYEACDEIGMLVSPELPIAYMRFYNRAGKAALELYKTEWANAITRYRNHPSIFDWCMGNELWAGIPLAPELYSIAKTLDPTRPVIDSDGLFEHEGYADGTKDRDTLDFYTVMFDILTTPFENPAKFETDIPTKPVISHETGNYVAFPRLDLIEEFTYNFKPFWLTPVREKIASMGLLEETPMWSDKSERLYYLSHKANMEALRMNPYITGYHWWLLQPWWPGSNGLVDVYRRPNSITAEEVRQINGPLVLLQEGVERTYTGGDRLKTSLIASNYMGTTISDAELKWSFVVDGEEIDGGATAVASVENATIAAIHDVEMRLPAVDTPTQGTLFVELDATHSPVTNQWTTWIFPSASSKPRLDVPLYASPDLLPDLKVFGAKPAPPVPGSGPAVYVARQPSPALLAAADAGATVLLLSPAGVFPQDVTTFKPAWWLGVFDGDSNAGTVAYDHPVTRDFAPDGWCDAGWLHLLQGAQTTILDEFPEHPEVVLRALNTHSAPHPFSRGLDFEYFWRDKSLLFQVPMGNGAVVVSGLNFEAALRAGGPEGSWMLARLIEYAASSPEVPATEAESYVRSAVERSFYAQGPLVSGFHQTVSHKGETAQGLSYREADATMLRIRQEEALHHVEWETAPVPDADRVTFVFAGVFPFMDPPHVRPGFGLSVNGTRVLELDTCKTGTTWTSADKEVSMTFVPSVFRSSWALTVGQFYLSVPSDMVKAGEPARLKIQSIGSDNSRWFGLNPYDDVLRLGLASR